MAKAKQKTAAPQRRSFRTRRKIARVNILSNPKRPVRPRLSVHRTGQHTYAQVIDDLKGVTLAAASTLDAEGRKDALKGAAAAQAVGKRLAERAKAAGVEQVVFDRGRFLYHGRVKAVADGAREGGLDF